MEMFNNNPEEFSDIAEFYTVGDDKYHHLKIKASVFLQIFCEKVDGAFKELLQLLSVIILGALDPSSRDSELVAEVKSSATQFNFNGLTNPQKL